FQHARPIGAWFDGIRIEERDRIDRTRLQPHCLGQIGLKTLEVAVQVAPRVAEIEEVAHLGTVSSSRCNEVDPAKNPMDWADAGRNDLPLRETSQESHSLRTKHSRGARDA